ncbi:hypothetical protein BC940DRAFT_275883 [Gongronella butleri]|nr:hypothetical protein BC940DRAFT_275883 [Gongronella butleri]
MFPKPISTYIVSLNKLIQQPQEHLADTCCQFNDSDVWVHRALLLCRCPMPFLQRLFPGLEVAEASASSPAVYDLRGVSHALFQHLVAYWYTAVVPAGLAPHVQAMLDYWEKELDITLLPMAANDEETDEKARIGHLQDLQRDLGRMLDEQIGCDIDLVVPSPDALEAVAVTFATHRFMLAAQSTYFYAMFCSGFCETHAPVLHLTDPFFTPQVMRLLLAYLYTDQVNAPLPEWIAHDNVSSSKLERSAIRKHSIKCLLLAYAAADYLGESHATLGGALLHAMATNGHQFKCTCHDCALILPAMLAFADTRRNDLPELRARLMTLYTDPVHAIQHLWSQKPFALLIHALLPSGASLIKTLDCSINIANTDHEPRSPLIHEMIEATFRNITKHNAIHVLHALHLCLSQLRSADHVPTWSLPTLDLLHPLLQSTVSMVSLNFDFYCVEYPILVSCVDGVGCGFSIDFLDFLLRHVLDEGIQDANAGIIYQGIVKDLIGRQETVKNVALDDVLFNARAQCADYLARRWISVKSLGGFRNVEKQIMRQMSDDIGIPYRTLSKPFDSDLLSLFTFRPKRSRAITSKTEHHRDIQPYASSNRRRSLGLRRTLSSQVTPTTTAPALSQSLSTSTTKGNRQRSLSAGSSLFQSTLVSARTDPSKGYVNCNTINALSTQPLIHLLSMETEARIRRQGHYASSTSSASSFVSDVSSRWDEVSLLDTLLPLEPIVPVHTTIMVKRKPAPTITVSPTTVPVVVAAADSKLIKFKLPAANELPPRVMSPAHPSLQPPEMNKNKKKKKRALSPMKWSFGHHHHHHHHAPAATPATANASTTVPAPLLSPPEPITAATAAVPAIGPLDTLSTSSSAAVAHAAADGSLVNMATGSNSAAIIVMSTTTTSGGASRAMITPVVGARVELRRRPLPTHATIKYVGPVDFANGTWIGVELDSRLGQNNGSVSGVSYFRTDAHRGLFLRPDDFTILSVP